MNWVRHGGSTTFETKSSHCRVARQGLPCYTAVTRLGFKRRATAVLKSNLIRSIQFGTAVARRLKRALLFFCISLTILCTVYPFVFTCGWSERPSVKANDTETWMQCDTFGTDFHLIQNGGTTKWFDALFDFLAAEAFPGILQPIKSTIATWAPFKLKRRNVVFKLKNTTFILSFYRQGMILVR